MKLYTTKIVAQYLDLSERRVRQLRDEGVLEEKAPGLYDLRSSVRRFGQEEIAVHSPGCSGAHGQLRP